MSPRTENSFKIPQSATLLTPDGGATLRCPAAALVATPVGCPGFQLLFLVNRDYIDRLPFFVRPLLSDG
jgi:hypothetical protein